MLSTWNAENINQVGPSQRGLGGGKSFKPLGDAGSSENPPSSSGKGMLQRKLKPLGSYSENAPPSAAKGKAAGGLGLPPNSSAKKQPRRALGDISNAGNGPAAAASNNGPSKLSGKQQLLTPGLKFTVHSDSNKGTVRPRGAGPRVVASGSGRSAVGMSNGRVDDIELALGRTGDEEEVLVERRAEERAAEKFARPHRSSAVRSSRSRSQSTSSSFPKASSSRSYSRSKGRFGRDITNTSKAGANAGGAAASASGVLEKSFDSAIKGIVRADFEEREKEISGDDKEKPQKPEARRGILEDDSDLDLDMEAVTMALEALESTPLDLMDDGFLTHDLDDLSFA